VKKKKIEFVEAEAKIEVEVKIEAEIKIETVVFRIRFRFVRRQAGFNVSFEIGKNSLIDRSKNNASPINNTCGNITGIKKINILIKQR
jgi:hypothetical protein